jgi:MFS family permease
MKNIRLLTIISALCFVATGISSILTSLYLQSLGANFSQIAFIQSSVVITMLVASYLWGHLSDRLGRRKPMLIGGLTILAIAYFFLSQAPTSGWAWGARVFEGIGSAAYATLSLAMMGDLLEKEKQRGQRIGIWRGLGSLGFALGAISGGWIAEQTSMAHTLLICVGLYAAAALCALALSERTPMPAPASPSASGRPTQPPSQPSSPPASGLAGLAKRALPAAFLTGVFFWVCAHSMSASMWPNYMKSFGYGTAASGTLWGFAAIVEMFVMYGAGTLSDRWGRPPLLITGALGIAVTNFGYLTMASFFPALLVVQLIRGVGFGSYTSTAMTYAAEHGDQHTRGRKTGIYNTMSSAGGLAGTLLAGNLVQFLGFSTLYATCVLLALTSAVCFWLLRRRSATRWTVTTSSAA